LDAPEADSGGCHASRIHSLVSRKEIGQAPRVEYGASDRSR
jgi:hypothetical protein